MHENISYGTQKTRLILNLWQASWLATATTWSAIRMRPTCGCSTAAQSKTRPKTPSATRSSRAWAGQALWHCGLCTIRSPQSRVIGWPQCGLSIFVYSFISLILLTKLCNYVKEKKNQKRECGALHCCKSFWRRYPWIDCCRCCHHASCVLFLVQTSL